MICLWPVLESSYMMLYLPQYHSDPSVHYFLFTDLFVTVCVSFVMAAKVLGQRLDRKGVCVKWFPLYKVG